MQNCRLLKYRPFKPNYARCVMNYQSFQDELVKKIDSATLMTNDQITNGRNLAIDQLIASLKQVETNIQHHKLFGVSASVSITIGPINIGLSKLINIE